MKVLFLVGGLVVGAIIGLWLSLLLFAGKPQNKPLSAWRWPDSLDAVVAARKNHQVLFENDAIRILDVKLGPYENEPMHTHRFSSVTFGRRPSDTVAFDIVYYRYDYDSTRRRYFIKDSFPQHRAASPADVADSGYYMKPEQPHSIRNLSNVTIDVYRVEFKN